MKTLTKIAVSAAILAAGLAIGMAINRKTVVIERIFVKSTWETILSHRQKIWLGALEWCESRGDAEAINPKDKDGTPSYYSFQFKPKTFIYYVEKYGVVPGGLTDQNILERMKDYGTTKLIVANMILDPKVKWEVEFPGCIKKLGRPPKN
jgi:hypothetical protein